MFCLFSKKNRHFSLSIFFSFSIVFVIADQSLVFQKFEFFQFFIKGDSLQFLSFSVDNNFISRQIVFFLIFQTIEKNKQTSRLLPTSRKSGILGRYRLQVHLTKSQRKEYRTTEKNDAGKKNKGQMESVTHVGFFINRLFLLATHLTMLLIRK